MRRGKNEKCEYFCFQARLMQASNVERGSCIEHLALLDEKLKKICLHSGRLVLYFLPCVSRNTLIKQEIFQALPKRRCKIVIPVFTEAIPASFCSKFVN